MEENKIQARREMAQHLKNARENYEDFLMQKTRGEMTPEKSGLITRIIMDNQDKYFEAARRAEMSNAEATRFYKAAVQYRLK